MNSLVATVTFAVSAAILTVMAVSNGGPANTICRNVVPGSIVEVMNCSHSAMVALPQASSTAMPIQQASLKLSAVR
jgi:hypothetical protein